jgi:hypothetical protein
VGYEIIDIRPRPNIGGNDVDSRPEAFESGNFLACRVSG